MEGSLWTKQRALPWPTEQIPAVGWRLILQSWPFGRGQHLMPGSPLTVVLAGPRLPTHTNT